MGSLDVLQTEKDGGGSTLLPVTVQGEIRRDKRGKRQLREGGNVTCTSPSQVQALTWKNGAVGKLRHVTLTPTAGTPATFSVSASDFSVL